MLDTKMISDEYRPTDSCIEVLKSLESVGLLNKDLEERICDLDKERTKYPDKEPWGIVISLINHGYKVNWRNLSNVGFQDLVQMSECGNLGIPVMFFVDFINESTVGGVKWSSYFTKYKLKYYLEEKGTDKELTSMKLFSDETVGKKRLSDFLVSQLSYLGLDEEQLDSLFMKSGLNDYDTFVRVLEQQLFLLKDKSCLYYKSFLLWYLLRFNDAELEYVSLNFMEWTLSPLFIFFYRLIGSKKQYFRKDFEFERLLRVFDDVDIIEFRSNRNDFFWCYIDQVIVYKDYIMNMLVDKINLVVNKIKTNTDAGVLKVYYEYSLLELNSVAPVVFNQLNSYPIRLYQIQREAKFYETDLGLVDLYTLDLYKPYDKKGKITDIIYSSDIYYRNAVLSMALAVQAGDESYKSLIKREDLGLPLVKTLKYFIKPEDSLYGAILRFLANVIGCYEEYQEMLYPRDINPYIILNDGTRINLLEVIVNFKESISVIKSKGYICPAIERVGQDVFLKEGEVVWVTNV